MYRVHLKALPLSLLLFLYLLCHFFPLPLSGSTSNYISSPGTWSVIQYTQASVSEAVLAKSPLPFHMYTPTLVGFYQACLLSLFCALVSCRITIYLFKKNIKRNTADAVFYDVLFPYLSIYLNAFLLTCHPCIPPPPILHLPSLLNLSDVFF